MSFTEFISDSENFIEGVNWFDSEKSFDFVNDFEFVKLIELENCSVHEKTSVLLNSLDLEKTSEGANVWERVNLPDSENNWILKKLESY